MRSHLPTTVPGTSGDDFVRRSDLISDTDILAIGENSQLVVYHRKYDSILIARHNSRAELDCEVFVGSPLEALQVAPIYAKILKMVTK